MGAQFDENRLLYMSLQKILSCPFQIQSHLLPSEGTDFQLLLWYFFTSDKSRSLSLSLSQ